MNVKKIAPLVFALILGGIAAKMAFNFVKNRQPAPQAKRVQVVVAKHNIDEGQVLSADDLTMGDVASETVPDTVYQRPDQLYGRVTIVPLIEGQAITTTLLAPRGVGAGLQATVPLGMRAITIDINEVTGVAGYLVPGCHVDVIQTVRDDKTGLPVARTLVQNVKITAVGMRHDATKENDGGGRSVTVLVTPEQAELIELACSVGRPRLSLRGGNDLAMVDTKDYTFAELIGRHDNTPTNDLDEIEPIISRLIPAAPSTQPTAVSANNNPTTRPSIYATLENEQWIIEIVRGNNVSTAKFALPPYAGQLGDTNAVPTH